MLYLLPEDQVQIHLFVQVRKSEILFLMLFNMLCDNVADLGHPGCIQLHCFFNHIFIKENKVDRVSAVVQAAQQAVLTIHAFCQDFQFLFHIHRRHIEFFSDLRRASRFLMAKPYDMPGKLPRAYLPRISPGRPSGSPYHKINILQRHRPVIHLFHFFHLTSDLLPCRKQTLPDSAFPDIQFFRDLCCG